MPVNVKIIRDSRFDGVSTSFKLNERGGLAYYNDEYQEFWECIPAEEMHEFAKWLADEMAPLSAEYEAIEQGRRPK